MGSGELDALVIDAGPDDQALDELSAADDEWTDLEEGRVSIVRRNAGVLFVALTSVVALGLVVLFFIVFAFGLSSVQEHRNQSQLYSELRGLLAPASTVAPWTGGDIPAGSPVALLNASAGGLHDVVVIQGTTSGLMRDGPGHLRNSPLPGQVGDSILIGRSATTGAPFADIGNLRRGDLITVTTGQGTFKFRVADRRVAGGALPKIPPSGSLLTMVTSVGSGTLGSIVNGHLLYVDAALTGKAVATPKGQPTVVARSEIQGRAEPAALPFVLLWLVALGVGLIGAVGLVNRWGWRRSWLVIAPITLAILWGLSNELLRLVPNVY